MGRVELVAYCLTVLFLACQLVIGIEVALQFRAARVGRRQRQAVPEGVVGYACVGEAVCFVVGVFFNCWAFGRTFAFGVRRVPRQAGPVSVFVVGIGPGGAAFADWFFLYLRQSADRIVGVGLFAEGARLAHPLAVDGGHHTVFVPFAFFSAVRCLYIRKVREFPDLITLVFCGHAVRIAFTDEVAFGVVSCTELTGVRVNQFGDLSAEFFICVRLGPLAVVDLRQSLVAFGFVFIGRDGP